VLNTLGAFAGLEYAIEELKTLIFPNSGLSNNQTLKEDGLDRIRTGDLRRVISRKQGWENFNCRSQRMS
jgi:hypothetical protein